MSDVAVERKQQAAQVNPVSVLALCSGIAFLDSSVVDLAFPASVEDFKRTSISTTTRIVSGHAVLFGRLALAGRVADYFGRRTVLPRSLARLTIASLGCGLAPSAGRALAGQFGQGADGSAGFAAIMVSRAAQ